MAPINQSLWRLMIRLSAWYLRHSRIEMGRWRIVAKTLPRLRRLGCSMGVKTIRTHHGFDFACNLEDWLGQYVYLTGTYERMTSELMARVMRAGDTALDIGANIGFFSLLLATRAGPRGHVYAFEPIPSVKTNLDKNIQLNKRTNITVFEAAATDQNGAVTIYEGPKDHKGVSSLRPLHNATQAVTIQAARLDDILDELESIRIVKIDVEGAEVDVLRGGKQLLQQHHPFLLIEFSPSYLSDLGASVGALETELSALGYAHLYYVADDGLWPLSDYSRDLGFQYNVLCSPHESLPEELAGLRRP